MTAHKDREPQRAKALKSVMTWFWRLFSSMRLALILIFIIAGLSLLGVLLIQVPSNVTSDSQLYSYWVDTVARNKLGIWAPFLSFLRLLDIFRSPWFLIAGILLMLNIFICSINRWSSIVLSLRGGVVKHKRNF